MPQLGSNEKPVLITNKKNGGRISKGSRPKPSSVSKKIFDLEFINFFAVLISSTVATSCTTLIS